VKRALLFFKRKEKIFFDLTLFLGLLRRVSPEQGSPAVVKLVPQHPFDAHGLSNIKSRALLFFSFLLTEMKIFFRKAQSL
jgi:hypothetical protein